MKPEQMTLLDYFAGQALAGMLSYSQNDISGNWANNCSWAGVAEDAYRYAEAMLAERELRAAARAMETKENSDGGKGTGNQEAV